MRTIAEILYIKRNTTPVLTIRVDGVNYNDLTKVVFGFKSCLHKNAPLLLKKIINKSSSDSFTDYSGGDGFTVLLWLTAEETFKFEPGDLFVDVYPVAGSSIINTGLPIRYEVIDTTLDEVIS